MTFRIDGRPRLQFAQRARFVPLALAFVVAIGCQPPPEGPAPQPPPPAMPPPARSDAAPSPPPPPPPTPDSGSVTEVDAGMPPDSGAPATDGGTGGDAAPAVSLFVDPLAAPPTNLKDVGLFTAFPDLTKVDPRAFPFVPRYPLYSNGLDKIRFAVLPPNTKIDTTTRDSWDFPVGTLMFKTFTFKDPARGGADRPVETRLIRRVSAMGPIEEQWEFRVWEWNEEGTAATLLDGRRRVPRQVAVGGQMFMHNIPSKQDCWKCHIANKSPVIGFDELRLNHTLPGNPQSLLQQVVAKQWLTRPPMAPFLEVTGGRNATERQVLEYAQANCVHCHNGVREPREPGQRYADLDLTPAVLVRSTVNQMTMSTGTAPGVRVLPGDPMRSILFLALRAVDDPTVSTEVKPMPLVGVDRSDRTAIDLFQRWIMALPR
jgi:hypothetical protein